jgi:hypothetical protein
LRNIELGLAEEVFMNADSRFWDNESLMFVALKRVEYKGRERDIGVIYKKKDEDILFVTVHPLKEGQKENRITSGRWKPL